MKRIIQKGFTFIPLLIAVAIFGIVGIGYQVIKSTIEKNYQFKDLPGPTATPTLTKSGWKTYTNELFSFEYPFEYEIEQTNDPEMIILIGKVKDSYETTYIDWREKEYSNITIKDKLNKMEKTDDIESQSNIKGGVDLIVTEDAKLGSQFGVNNSRNRIVILDSNINRLIKLTTNPPVENSGYKFDQILSTFRFLDESVDPTTLRENDRCVISGCSGEICASEEMFSTCELKPESVCYKTATCEVQENGNCGWTQTEELRECLNKY